MIPQHKAQIFLAEERGIHESNEFRRYLTLSYGEYYNQYKNAIGPLYLINDETLAGNTIHNFTADTSTIIVVIPIVGKVNWETSTGEKGQVEAGESLRLCIPPGTIVTYSNPYSEELVNFIQLWFSTGDLETTKVDIYRFDILSHKDKLINIFSDDIKDNPELPQCQIGCFNGRSEVLIQAAPNYNTLFGIVIKGAFELQYRLLEEKDALALWNIKSAELEALSSDAIILIAAFNS